MKQQQNNLQLVTVLLVLALIVLGLFSIKSCNQNRKLVQDFENALNYKDTVMYYKSKNGDLVAYNSTLSIQLSNFAKVNSDLEKEIRDLKIKKPQVITKTVTKVEVKEVLIPYEVKLPCDSFSIPISFNDGWIAIGGKSTDTGISFDSIVLRNDMTIAVGEKNNGLFKRNESIVAIKSNNPYFKTESLQNYTFKPKEPFYDKWWFKTSIFVSGFVLGTTVK